MGKVKTLANLLFVPKSIWESQKKSERGVPSPQTEAEREEYDFFLSLGRAGELYLELLRGSAYLTGVAGLGYHLIK